MGASSGFAIGAHHLTMVKDVFGPISTASSHQDAAQPY